MNLVILILAIISFIASFIPKFGIIITLVFSTITCIFTTLILKNNNAKVKKDSAVISLIISIVALFVCLVINIIFFSNKSIFNANNKNKQLGYIDNFETYTTYQKDDYIVLENEFEMKINSSIVNEMNCIINISIKPLEENLSIYNFCLIDTINNEVYYPEYSIENDVLSFRNLIYNKMQDGNIVFNVNENFNFEQAYLVYKNDTGIKIKI